MAVGPNDDPNFEHRLLLAFALCVLLFLVVLTASESAGR